MLKLSTLILLPIVVSMFLVSPVLDVKAFASQVPRATDMSQPDFLDVFSYTRLLGKEEAVYFQLPASQVSTLIPLSENPSPIVFAKYEREKATGNIFLMRIWQAGAWVRGEILRITPRNFYHPLGPSLYNFAFLNWNPNNDATCNAQKSSKYPLGTVQSPGADVVNEVERKFVEYDIKVKEYLDAGYDKTSAQNAVFNPLVSLRMLVGNPSVYNRADLYWFQRLNDDPCWEKVSASDFDQNNGMFNNISEPAFYNFVALTMELHKAGVGVIIFPKVRQEVSTSTSKSAFRKKVTTTVRYYVYPEYLVVFPKRVSQSYGEFTMNPGNSIRSTGYDFIKVKGNHSFPVDETLIYQWSRTKSGWTGLAVFLGGLVLGALLGGIGSFAFGSALTNIAAGAAIGGIGGLVASGFNPTTSVTAQFTPFIYSKYQLDPSSAWSGDAKRVADETFSKWLTPDVQNTPGGVSVFVSRIDMRKAVLCGGASQTQSCNPSVSDAVVQVHADDPRYWSIFKEMFHHASQELMKYKYPFTTK
jgi:hypothetical protein